MIQTGELVKYDLLSGELEKYEYLTSEALGYKPGLVEKANLNILYWVKSLIKDYMKKTKNTNVLKD